MSKNNNSLEQLEFENKLLRAIFDNIHESVSVTNIDGTVLLYNLEAEKCEGINRNDVLGKHEQDLYPAYYDKITRTVIDTGKPLLGQQFKYILPNGQECDLLVNSFPFYYQNTLKAVITIGKNVRQVNEFINRAFELHTNYYSEINRTLKNGTRYSLDNIIGTSEQIRHTVSLARKVASRNSPILICGKTGTGKELFAQGIHRSSSFNKGPFIAVNCAAIPETLLESLIFGTARGAFTGASETPGLFEQAENGTLFLDEINSMPISLQAKLLRVLQDKIVRRIGGKEERSINCRIISATNVDPNYAIKEQQIREDLYYRLATVTLQIPSLKERKEDIKVLTKHFFDKYNREFGLHLENISPELYLAFEKYHWPGNVRELQNIIESAMNFVDISDRTLSLKHIPTNFRDKLVKSELSYFPEDKLNSGTLHEILLYVEKKVIENVLQKNNGKIGKTAQELGIFRQALRYRIKKLGLDKTVEGQNL